jgi:hypothetical protein
MDRAKPYNIPKREVWEAYKTVRANHGAAGVDGQTISDFEADLENNLYKLWNRLSSGSYFPPPVRRVGASREPQKTYPLVSQTMRPFCTSMAQRTASTTLRNSMRLPSPVRLTMRP